MRILIVVFILSCSKPVLCGSYVRLFNEPIFTNNSTIRYKLSQNIKVLKSKGITPQTLKNRAEKLFPIYEAILAQYGVPDDFKYLSVIESNLNVEATSPVGAKGLWQFMPATAREHGMYVSSHYDERLNVISSTKNACIYLRRNKKHLGSWILTAASYNCGMGCIKKSIRNNQTNDYFQMQLNKETSDYVYRILAAKMLFEDYFDKNIEFNESRLTESSPLEIKNIIVDSIRDTSELISNWNYNAKTSKPSLKEIKEITLRNTFKKFIDSNTKDVLLTIVSNDEFNGMKIKFDLGLDSHNHRIYLSKMLYEVDAKYADLVIKAIDKDMELGLAMPDFEINRGNYQLDNNLKFIAKLYQYE